MTASQTALDPVEPIPAPTGHTKPPRPRVAFRVGIIGHRPNRLVKADRAALREILRSVLAHTRGVVETVGREGSCCYEPGGPILRAVSSLAEGTDRLFAREALELGYELCCPMPFLCEEYRKDFETADSVEEFTGLLEGAKSGPGLTTFELDGCRSDPGSAYGAAGRVVLNQSDLLVVVWDGEPAAGRGGTVNTLYEAKAFHVPILWIDAEKPHRCQLVGPEDVLPPSPDAGERRVPSGSALPLEEIGSLIVNTLTCPGPGARPEKDDAGIWGRFGRGIGDRIDRWRGNPHDSFLRERKPHGHPWFIWRLFRDLVGDRRWTFQSFAVEDFERAVAADWPVEASDLAAEPDAASRRLEDVETWVNRRLRPYYAWSDRPAFYKSEAYRSAFVASYFLAALAVFCALLPRTLLSGWLPVAERIVPRIELLALGTIILLVVLGWCGRWHDRWMDYRLLAERIRQLRILIPLGGGRPFPRLPAFLETYPNPERAWMSSYTRAVSREIGVPPARFTSGYLSECLDYIERLVLGQLDFHSRTARRDSRIAHAMHAGTVVCLVITVGAVGAHVLQQGGPMGALLVFIAAGLPAFGAALEGIVNQGEFTRVSRRSAAMKQRFEAFQHRIDLLRAGGAPGSAAITSLAMEIAQLMVEEVLDWRVVFLDRPLRTP